MKIFKSYKYRIYPDKEQCTLIQKTFGCCRFVYNNVLSYRNDMFRNQKKYIGKFECTKYMVDILKSEFEWLREVDKYSLQNSIFDMDIAYQKFFKKQGGFPKFKSKHERNRSYTTNCCYPKHTVPNIEVSFERKRIKLPKLKWIKAKISRAFDGRIKSVTVSQTASGKYFVSILAEEEQIELPKSEKSVGIDLGIKDLVITSDGKKSDNLKLIKKYEDKLAREQRKLSHKKRGSKNREKQRIKVAKIHEKIANARNDYLHKISRKLINENQVIVSEDLSVSNMVKNHNLAKAISDCGWGELTRQLQYKAEWYGRTYIKIGRFIPSSQMCHVCCYQNKETKDLSVRKWICPQCGTEHDRDINAAINILHEGLKQIA